MCINTHAHTPVPQFIHCDFYRPDLILSFSVNGMEFLTPLSVHLMLYYCNYPHSISNLWSCRAKITLSVYKTKCREGQTQLFRGLQSAKPHRGPPAGSRGPPWRPAKADAQHMDFSYVGSQKPTKLTGVSGAGKVTFAKWNPWPVFTMKLQRLGCSQYANLSSRASKTKCS